MPIPALIEASLSHVPLICISADRPFQLRNSGANQTIDQIHLFPRVSMLFLQIFHLNVLGIPSE